MKPSVYIETSVISYLTSRPSRDLIIAAHQQITNDWWENYLSSYEVLISEIVIDEISAGDKFAAYERKNSVKNFKILKANNEVENLTISYMKTLNLPDKAFRDAGHIAFANVYNIDYILTWNCTHIANAQIRLALVDYNQKNCIHNSIICTPEELIKIGR